MRGFRRVLMIGLGGSGKGILVNLRRQLMDSCGVVPPCFKFLVLDTDQRMEAATSRKDGSEIALGPGDLIHLGLPDPVGFLQNAPPATKEMLYDKSEVSIRSITNGAHGIRFAGRLALLSKIVDVEREIQRRIRDLNDLNLPRLMEQAKFELYDGNPEICICGSIAGGTGSGIFFDIAILCRQLARRVSYAADLKVVGIFLLPWVYEDLPTTQNCRSNGYAALCELDYLMDLSNLRRAGGAPRRYRAFYTSEVDVDRSPFDLVHLIDGRNELGENRANVGDLIAAVSDAITCEVSELGVHAGSHLDNIIGTFSQLPPDLWGGRFPHYTSFGIGTLYYPAQEKHAIQSLTSAIALLDEAKVYCEDSSAISSDVLGAEIDACLNDLQVDERNHEMFARQLLGITGSDTQFRFARDFDYGSRGLGARVTSLRHQYVNRLEQILNDRGESYLSEKRNEFIDKIRDRAARRRREEADGRRSPLFTLSWLERLHQTIDSLHDQFNETIRGCNLDIANLENDENGHLEDIRAGSHGIFRRRRQGACEKYAQLISRLLALLALRRGCTAAASMMADLRKEVDELMASVRSSSAGVGEIHSNLNKAQAKLQSNLRNIKNALRRRKENPFEVLIGPDDNIFDSGGDNTTGLKFEVFRSDCAIKSPLDLNKKPEALEELFLKYTKNKLEGLLKTTIDQVLKDQEQVSQGYTQKQFHHALRLASTLWSFEPGLLTPERQAHMYHIVVCGHESAAEGEDRYRDVIERLRVRMNMNFPPTWSSTGDPHRIVILKYSVSLPAYALSSMKEYRAQYELQMLPPAHCDKRLRFQLDDLFPEKTGADKAFRVLTLAIIPEVGVIKDEKLDKGHRYTIDYPGELNDEYDPIICNSFVDLFAYLQENRPAVDFLCAKVIERFEAKGQGALKPAIEKYLREMDNRFSSTDFTKQITGRYYYKEVKLLRDLLASFSRGKTVRDFFTH